MVAGGVPLAAGDFALLGVYVRVVLDALVVALVDVRAELAPSVSRVRANPRAVPLEVDTIVL